MVHANKSGITSKGSALHYAVEHRRQDVVQFLLKDGAPCNAVNLVRGPSVYSPLYLIEITDEPHPAARGSAAR